jgi:hypothetical protein
LNPSLRVHHKSLLYRIWLQSPDASRPLQNAWYDRSDQWLPIKFINYNH